MSGCGCELDETATLERTTLRLLLLINVTMFVIEGAVGWWGESTGLLADALDMLADAAVYGIALYVVGGSVQLQANAATASGILQIALGLGVLAEIAHRFFYGSNPVSTLMMVFGAIALVANVSCLMLISKHREGGVHMRASWIFSTNDVIANIGVIFSGGLVLILGSRVPDLIIGGLISMVVIRGGIQILGEVKAMRR